MTRQIRTWHESEADQGVKRWDIAINDTPVSGGYILQLGEESFEAHYPHLETTVFGTIEEAKYCLENLPPVTTGVFPIGKLAADADDEFLTTEEAGKLLGVSRYRVNAMVVNGVLSSKRENGQILVSRRSVEKKLGREQQAGPEGRFANPFIKFSPNGESRQLFLIECDHEDAEQIEEAKAFLSDIHEGKIAGTAEVIGYRDAMKILSQSERGNGIDEGEDEGEGRSEGQSVSMIEFEAFIKSRDTWLKE